MQHERSQQRLDNSTLALAAAAGRQAAATAAAKSCSSHCSSSTALDDLLRNGSKLLPPDYLSKL
jgi:hypothetical protein